MDRVRTERERERERTPACRVRELFLRLSGAFLLAAMGLFPCAAHAADVCRLTFFSAGPLTEGQVTTIQVRVDHAQVPPGTQEQNPSLAIRAFSVGIGIPEGVTLVGADFAGTVVEEALGPMTAQFSAIYEVPGGVIVTAFLSGNLATVIPPGLWQPLVNVHLQALSGPAVGGHATFEFRDNLPGQRDATGISLVCGEVLPRTRALTLPVLPATLPPPLIPIVPQGYSDPTPDELGLHFLEPPQPASSTSEGGSAASRAGTGNCAFVTALGDPATILSTGTDCGPDNVACVPSQFPTVQDALDFYLNTPGLYGFDYTIVVSDGDYPPFTVDWGDFSAVSPAIELTIISENGPESTTILSDGTQPAITVIDDPLLPTTGNLLRIGWTDFSMPPTPWFCPPEDFLLNRQGWRGFTITVGTGSSHPGIQLQDMDNSTEIRGNIVDANGGQYTMQGGGIAATRCKNLLIALNEISNNVVVLHGAGMFLSDTQAIVAENFIHHNSIYAWPTVMAGFGGGVYSERSDVELCNNAIYRNKAIQGCGVYMLMESTWMTTHLALMIRSILEGNRICANEALEVANPPSQYLGGGVCLVTIDYPCGSTGQCSTMWEMSIIHNKIHENMLDVSDHVAGTTELGGGLYVRANLLGILGLPYGLSVVILGNMIYENTAGDSGGGVWLGTFSSDPSPAGEVLLLHNTITSNTLTEGQDGTGILLAFDAVLGYCLARGDGNIVYHNTADEPPGGSEWFAQCDPTWASLPPPGNAPWGFSQMEDLFPGSDCSTDTKYNLFGGISPDDTGPPLIVNPMDPHVGSAASPCVDRGNPAFNALNFPVDVDIDGDDRFIFTTLGSPANPIIDRGGDEYREAEFKRGDANSDDVINIADTIKILDVLFNGVLPENCEDAVDVNDDGVMNIADPIYLQSYLFAGGPEPPAPGPNNCGPDPTATDNLELCVPGHNQCP